MRWRDRQPLACGVTRQGTVPAARAARAGHSGARIIEGARARKCQSVQTCACSMKNDIQTGKAF